VAEHPEDQKLGLYGKYWVRRRDGSSRPGEKHEFCNYYVLDLDYDPFAVPAVRSYADACESEYPELAKDLRALANNAEAHWKAKAMKEWGHA
jgi:hypothetical protein